MDATIITKTIEVKDFNVTFTEADLAEMRVDPQAFARKVLKALNGKVTVTERVKRQRRTAKPKAKANRPNGARRGRPPKEKQTPGPRARGLRAAANGSRKPVEYATCPVCQKEIAAKYLNNHLKKKHGQTNGDFVPAAEF
jgi:hypothetical protein